MSLGKWIGFLALAASLYILWEIRQILLLVFAAVVLANSLNLLAQWFQKKGLRRSGAVLLSVLFMLLAIVIFVWLIVPPFTQQFQELFVLVPKGINQLNNQIEQWLNQMPRQFSPYLPSVDNLIQQAQPFVNRVLSSSVAFFSTSLGSILNFLLVVVWGLMLLVNPLAYRQGFIRVFPSFYRRRVDAILLECEIALGRWIIGALISMGVVAVFSWIGLVAIGVPAALAQGVLSGLLNFIPNLGPTFSVVPPMLISLLDPHTPILKALLVLGLYILIQQLESNLLTPYVMAQQVSLLPALTLLGQVFFATLFGFLGLLLAIPLMVVCQIWIRRVLIEDVMDHWGNSGDGRELAAEIAVSEAEIIHTSSTVTDSKRQKDQEKLERGSEADREGLGNREQGTEDRGT
ncbi:AI-2E family transporter [Kovacikia minuta CCNUW1]|uniref:AI-2E family transporter n=1 Tax=Kovacikia minuta TaxID=2931930 RepID=UPI001CCBD5BC|nr:AI-2E family transporter [Kovacikia minuta]UBF25020.1 AI-2E family transporter [Kovacikia minuta CCNUW1]